MQATQGGHLDTHLGLRHDAGSAMSQDIVSLLDLLHRLMEGGAQCALSSLTSRIELLELRFQHLDAKIDGALYPADGEQPLALPESQEQPYEESASRDADDERSKLSYQNHDADEQGLEPGLTCKDLATSMVSGTALGSILEDQPQDVFSSAGIEYGPMEAHCGSGFCWNECGLGSAEPLGSWSHTSPTGYAGDSAHGDGGPITVCQADSTTPDVLRRPSRNQKKKEARKKRGKISIPADSPSSTVQHAGHPGPCAGQPDFCTDNALAVGISMGMTSPSSEASAVRGSVAPTLVPPSTGVIAPSIDAPTLGLQSSSLAASALVDGNALVSHSSSGSEASPAFGAHPAWPICPDQVQSKYGDACKSAHTTGMVVPKVAVAYQQHLMAMRDKGQVDHGDVKKFLAAFRPLPPLAQQCLAKAVMAQTGPS